jgi:hypothetical protein
MGGLYTDPSLCDDAQNSVAQWEDYSEDSSALPE